MGEGTFFLLYSLVIFTVCREKVRFPLLLFESLVFSVSHARFSFKSLLKPGIICTFLIHSGSLQKMLTALFNLVWNTQKSKSTIFLECRGKVLLPYCFSPHF